jgi:YVTN family beta-propeller protein
MTAPGPGYSMPQDVRLSAGGTIFYVADMATNGILLINARTFRVIRFLHTRAGTHGFLVSRNGRYLYISNRGQGSISVLDMATNTLVHKWWIPGGGSPDMGGISPDGNVMWWSGRYNSVVYAMSTPAPGGCSPRSPSGPDRTASACSRSPAGTHSGTLATSADRPRGRLQVPGGGCSLERKACACGWVCRSGEGREVSFSSRCRRACAAS